MKNELLLLSSLSYQVPSKTLWVALLHSVHTSPDESLAQIKISQAMQRAASPINEATSHTILSNVSHDGVDFVGDFSSLKMHTLIRIETNDRY
jgi:hypothetical protein